MGLVITDCACRPDSSVGGSGAELPGQKRVVWGAEAPPAGPKLILVPGGWPGRKSLTFKGLNAPSYRKTY